MPFYEYHCTECDRRFTRQESMDQHERRRSVKCPGCGSRKTRKTITAAHVQTAKKS